MGDRPRHGITHGRFNYTPDVELAVQDGNLSARAWVEFKPLRKSEFKKEARLRMCGAARHYRSILLFLYVEKSKKWYKIDPKTAIVTDCARPEPGAVDIDKLPKPFAIPSPSYYGYRYIRAFQPLQSITIFIVEIIEEIIIGPKPKRRHRKS